MEYYNRNIGDYLRDTHHLTFVQHGIYNRLLDVYYVRESGLPADRVATLVGAKTKAEKGNLRIVLEEFFKLEDGVWRREECDKKIAAAKKPKSKNG